MSRYTTAFMTLCLLLGSLLPLGAGVQAQGTPPPAATPTPTPPPPSSTLISAEDLVPLLQIGLPKDEVLHGPYDSKRLRFGLPPTWELQPGAELYLNLNAFFTNPHAGEFGIAAANGGSLEVTFNNHLIATIIFDWTGERTVRIPIPDEALQAVRSDGRHELYLFLNAAIDCTYDNQTSITVRANSQFYFPHDIRPPLLDLSLLPRPIYQLDSFQTDTAIVVAPDNPTREELEAAYLAVGSMARMTRNTLIPPLLLASEVTPQIAAENHIIFVGLPEAFRAFSEAEWPLAFEGGRFEDLQAEDGLIQMTVSPESDTRVWVMVTGNEEQGLRKAAQAFSSGALRTSGRPDVALVSNVESSIAITEVPDDRTFSDLGYSVQTANGFGVHYFDIKFYLPPGMTTSEDAYLDLRFNHSAMIDFARSGMLVYLNDRIIGSTRFSEDSAKQGQEDFVLPRYALLPGVNRLVIAADLIPTDYCSNLVLSNLWITLTPDSLLHLPLMPMQFALMDFRNLGNYPNPFVASPTLSSLAFILPPDDPQTWKLGALVAADLSRRRGGAILEFGVAFADEIPDAFRQRDWIMLGRPSALPVLSEMAEALPVPFRPGEDIAAEQGLQISYRIPAGTSLGYLELFAPPQDSQRTLLGVFGSTPEGLSWAVNALLESALRGRLSGNFAVVRGEHLFTADTRMGLGSGNLAATAVPDVTSLPVQFVTPTPAAQTHSKPGWIIPVIAVSSALALLLLGAIIFRSVKREP